MSFKSKIDVSRFKHILVAPLDWGLGHATRCIPLINYFLNSGIQVHLAGNGDSLNLLLQEFPDLSYSVLPDYAIKYPHHGKNFGIKVMLQSPKILAAIRKEHLIVNQLANEYGCDMILSDNRYGCYSHAIHSVFMGHQLNLKLPKSLIWANTLNRRLINRFNEIWVPDHEFENGLSGELSHHSSFSNVKFIGPLSRFKRDPDPAHFKYQYLAIISGPEPQKRILTDIIQSKFKSLDQKTAIVLGNPKEQSILKEGNLTILNHLPAKALNDLINESKNVLCRSGYSSIMDMVSLNKSAYIIPTPGQPEQEYLANYLDGKLGFKKVSQDDLKDFELLN